MEIIVHLPKDQVNIDTLKKRVAIVHAEAVLKYIDKLPCPKEQKIEMVNSIINNGKNVFKIV